MLSDSFFYTGCRADVELVESFREENVNEVFHRDNKKASLSTGLLLVPRAGLEPARTLLPTGF
jgi:hypothetical protein